MDITSEAAAWKAKSSSFVAKGSDPTRLVAVDFISCYNRSNNMNC